MKTKKCTSCKKELSESMFSKRTGKYKTLYSYCRKCSSLKSMISYKKRVAVIEYEQPKVMPVTEFERALKIGLKA